MSVDSAMTRLNPLVRAVLRSQLHPLLSWGLMLIDVTGRRTGRTYSIPVGYQRHGDRLSVLVSEAERKQWWRNYRDARAVDVWLRGRRRRGRASVLGPQTAAFRADAERTLRRLPPLARVFGVEYDRSAGLTESALERLGERIAIVEIDLDDAA